MSIRLEYSTTAKCSPADVWQKFSKVEEWAWWNRVIGNSRWVSGRPWEKGSRLHLEFVRPLNLKLDVTIAETVPPNKTGWAGKARGARTEHWFSFEPQPEGATLLKTWQEFSGLGSMFLGNGTRQDFVKMYEAWFEQLKVEAERLAREAQARS